MDGIKVSVCMTTYNHERYIAQAVDSVLAQHVSFPIEIVIGEDRSTDRTQEILREFAERHPETIRLKLGEHNVGGKANFIATKARCRGQYIAMLEGDDYWTDADKLQRQVDALDAHPEWAMCFHPCACLYEDGLQGIPIYPIDWTKPVATIEDLFSSNFLPTSAVLFRNRLFPDFPDWFRDLLIGDWPLHILNAVHGDIGFMPEIMSAYRVHRAGIWGGATEAERLVAVFEVFSAVDHHLAGKYTHLINAYRSATIRHVMTQLHQVTTKLDAYTNRVFDVAEQLGSTQAQLEVQARDQAQTQAHAEAQAAAYAQEAARTRRLEADLEVIQSQRQDTLNNFAQLELRYATLEENTLRLQAFYETWTKSILYRVEREIRRPFRKLKQYLQDRAHSNGPHEPPRESGFSKAA